MRRRNVTTTARELIPPRAEMIRKDVKPTSNERKKLRASLETLTSQIALSAIESLTVGALRVLGLGALEPLIKSDLVKDAIANLTGSKKKSKEKQGFQSFWSSQSAVLKLGRDEVRRLPQVKNVSGVIPNRTVRLPTVVETRRVPQAIQDYKMCSWGLEKTAALSVWGVYGTRGTPMESNHPVKVAVLDTGVDPNHPELKDKVVDWAEFDEDGQEVEGSTPHDSGQHGTHVCGTIAGSRSESPSSEHPFIGMAPDAKLAVGLVLNGGSGTYAQILAGIDWAIEAGAEIINMSLGDIGFEPDVLDVYTRSILNANRAGIPVIVSIGNEGAQTSGSPGNDFFSFAVGATDHTDRPGGFSGGRTQIVRNSRYIPEKYLPLVYVKPEISAPGVAIRSCVPDNKYSTWNGTSMAAPHVAGALALLLAATDIRSIPVQRRAFVLQDLLVSSVDEMGEAGKDHRFGFDRVNVLRAVGFAKEQGY